MNLDVAIPVALTLIFGPGLLIAGFVLISRASGQRRRSQLQYADWVHSQGYPVPPPFGMPPGTPPSAGAVPPAIPYPPEVLKAGSGERVAGGILLGIGVLTLLGRCATVSAGM